MNIGGSPEDRFRSLQFRDLTYQTFVSGAMFRPEERCGYNSVNFSAASWDLVSTAKWQPAGAIWFIEDYPLNLPLGIMLAGTED